jgi:hypothetical protein
MVDLTNVVVFASRGATVRPQFPVPLLFDEAIGAELSNAELVAAKAPKASMNRGKAGGGGGAVVARGAAGGAGIEVTGTEGGAVGAMGGAVGAMGGAVGAMAGKRLIYFAGRCTHKVRCVLHRYLGGNMSTNR